MSDSNDPVEGAVVRRVLLDTDVTLDALLRRAPWDQAAIALWHAIEAQHVVAVIAAVTLTNVFYLTRRARDLVFARAAVQTCLHVCQIGSVDHRICRAAMQLPGSDFEDNVQIAVALAHGLAAIVTRDQAGFRQSPVPALTPGDLLARLATPP